MDAFALLIQDHREVADMLEKASDTTERAVKTRDKLLAEIKQMLEIHEKIEEKIFYPAIKDHPKTHDLTLEAYAEHDLIDTLLAELAKLASSDEFWAAKLKVLKENVEHHVHEEEDNLFKLVKQNFANDEIEQLGQQMADLKQQLQQQSM